MRNIFFCSLKFTSLAQFCDSVYETLVIMTKFDLRYGEICSKLVAFKKILFSKPKLISIFSLRKNA